MILSRLASSTKAGMGPASSPAPRAKLADDADRVDRPPAPMTVVIVVAPPPLVSSPSAAEDAPSRLLARLGVRRVDANDGRGLALRPDRPCVST